MLSPKTDPERINDLAALIALVLYLLIVSVNFSGHMKKVEPANSIITLPGEVITIKTNRV